MSKLANQNIVFYNSSHCSTGLERNTLKMMHALQERGNKILLFAPVESYLAVKSLKKGIHLVDIERSHKYVNLKVARRLAQKLKEKKSRILIVVRPRDIVTAVLVKLFFKKDIKLIFYQQIRLALEKVPFLYSLLFSRFDRWFIIMNYMEKQVREFSRLKPRQIVHIPVCLGTKKINLNQTRSEIRKKYGIPDDLFVMGSRHRFHPNNKLDFLIRAVQFLNRHNYKSGLFLQGFARTPEEIEYYEFLKELRKECQVEDCVFINSIPSMKEGFYQAIDAFAEIKVGNPYNTRLIKSMYAGTPVLAPFSDTNSEILSNGSLGLLFKANDIEDFAAKIIRLSTQEKVRKHLAEESRKYVEEQYAIDKSCALIEASLEELI